MIGHVELEVVRVAAPCGLPTTASGVVPRWRCAAARSVCRVLTLVRVGRHSRQWPLALLSGQQSGTHSKDPQPLPCGLTTGRMRMDSAGAAVIITVIAGIAVIPAVVFLAARREQRKQRPVAAVRA